MEFLSLKESYTKRIKKNKNKIEIANVISTSCITRSKLSKHDEGKLNVSINLVSYTKNDLARSINNGKNTLGYGFNIES